MGRVSDSALEHWRSLLAAIAPGVAVATVVQSILGASAGVVIADGSFIARPGWHDTAAAVVWLLAWTLSLGAAMIVVRGALVDAPVRGAFAIRAAVGRWIALILTIVVGVVLLILFVLLASVLAQAIGPLALVPVLVAAVAGCMSMGALALAVLAPVSPLLAISRAWELSVGRRFDAFFRGLFVVLVGLAVTWAQPRIAGWASGPVSAFLLTFGLAVVSVIVIGFQASLLARWFVLIDRPDLGLGSVPRRDRWQWSGALLVAAAVAVSIVTALNPWGVPVLASSTATEHDPVMVAAGGGTILPDGRRLTVFHNGGGPQVHFEICGTESYCDTKLLSTFDNAGFLWEYRAALVVGDGLAIAALVQQRGDSMDEAHLVVWHCPTIACDRTTRTVVGPVALSAYLVFAGDVDAQGHPQFAWGSLNDVGSATLVRCQDAGCTHSSADTVTYAAEVDGQWPGLAGLGFDAQHRLVAALVKDDERDDRAGLQIRIAEPARQIMVATVTCRSLDCQDRAVRRWHIAQGWDFEVVRPAAGPDGDLVLVAGRWVGTTSSGRLIRCESSCG